MNILYLIIFGALVGWVASVLMKSNASQGAIGDIILGVVGSIAGGLLMNFLGKPGVTGFNVYSIVVGVIGSMAVILIGRLVLAR